MIILFVCVLVLGLCLLLKLHWIIGLLLLGYSIGISFLYRKNQSVEKKQKQRFFEASEYMENLLYIFAREQKIEQTFENLTLVLAPTPMQELVKHALEHMRLTFDESEVYRDGLRMVEAEYSCTKIVNMHDFIYHVENYGGDIEGATMILLEDKNWWERRVRAAMEDRKRMYRQVILSVAASLLICGIIINMPIRNMNVAVNWIVQIVGMVVVMLDEILVLAAQRFLCVDWLLLENPRQEELGEKKLLRLRDYDIPKGRRKSILLAHLGLAVTVLMLFLWGKWAGFVGIAITFFLLNQHKVDLLLLRRAVTREISTAFPQWLLDMTLFLQSENVQVALCKSVHEAPLVLKREIQELNERLEMEAESAEPYHDFLKDFPIPEVHSAMSMLYSISMGNSSYVEKQLGELMRQNMSMMDEMERTNHRDRASGLYLLFLAPVLTASVKLLVDMFVVMFSFLTTISV